ncbi:hypothetical protein K491DRAFT_721177 [Lophiostoma macrostomum CBS 122681]|uniref:C2H2-type domain-containing protein n=1 Tax=Lophiostoma macrostomum CBS 122681 TaxID=1314788 RepID=A0A6A6SQL4_9PLEO|nr:hypothetical protein K491DRAFT_721177 [Lophiostoma macrostomum CBS 122681]
MSSTLRTAQGASTDIEASLRSRGTRDARLRCSHGTPNRPSSITGNSEMYQQFFNKYNIADLMRGYELAQDPDLFNIARKYRDKDIRLLLQFVEDEALEFFEAMKGLRGSDVIDLRDTTFANSRCATPDSSRELRFGRGSHAHHTSDTSRDSGYASRPSSEVEDLLATSDGQPYKSSSASSNPINDDALSVNISLSIDSSPRTYLPEAREHHSSSLYIPQSPFSFAGDSMAPTPTARSNASRLFECMYCGKDFARYGYCLNHERSYHNQHKKWICPHCDIPFDTKTGCDRHHRGHGCLHCEEPERVQILSDLKTACVCPYCGALFEGTSCFPIRADHVKSTHYKGETRRTRADMDYSRIIEALLSRRELSIPWKAFLETKPNVKLSWPPKKARELVDDLEFGEYTTGIQDLLRRVYELADKSEVLLNTSSQGVTTTGAHDEQISTNLASTRQIRELMESPIPFTDDLNFDTDPDDMMEIDGSLDRPMRVPADDSMSTAHRTRQILTRHLTASRPADTTSSKENLTEDIDFAQQQYEHLPADLRENVFMGYGKDTLDGLEPMNLMSEGFKPFPTLTRQSPTPPSQSWAFGELDGPLKHMEDIMMQQNLAYSAVQASADAAYAPPAWQDSLPPSLRNAAVNTVPPSRPLPTRPPRYIPGSTPRH